MRERIGIGFILALLAVGSAACGAHLETVDEASQGVNGAADGSGQYSLSFVRGMRLAGAAYDGVEDATIQRLAPNLGSSEYCSSKGGSTQRSCLLRWDLSHVPRTAKVQGVLLQVMVADPSRGTFRVYDMRRSWAEGEADFQKPQAGESWGLPGANSTVDAGSAPLGAFKPSARGSLSIPLNAAGVAVVQGWIDDPSKNAGLKLYNPRPYDGTSIRSSDVDNVSERPTLVVVLGD